MARPTMKQRKLLSDYIRKNKRRAGITIDELGRRTGISGATLGEYMRMDKYPRNKYSVEEVMAKVRKACEGGETE